MEVMYPRCAGLDVHKDSVVARIRCVSEPLHDEVKTFATTTSALLQLNEWLSAHAVTHVAMEATGVYWKPVWHLLEGDFELILANGRVYDQRARRIIVNRQIDPTTGTLQIQALFPNPDRAFWPNQFVKARLLLDTQKDALVMPAAAVQRPDWAKQQ